MVTRKKRTRRKKPGAVQGGGNQNRQLNCRRRTRISCIPQPSQERQERCSGGSKQVTQLPAAVPSAKRNPTSPSRTCGKGSVSKQFRTSAPRPPSTGPSSLHPSAPVELPPKVVPTVKQVAQKRKATTRPTNSPSPTRWELAHSRIKGRFKNYITPPL